MKVRYHSHNTDSFTIFFLVVWAAFIISWFINGYMLTQCDFSDGNHKCEIAHAVGVLAPPLAPIMIFVD